jgi:hypothetical protein
VPLKQAWRKNLAEYKHATKAANLGKEEFPRPLKNLWDTTANLNT